MLIIILDVSVDTMKAHTNISTATPVPPMARDENLSSAADISFRLVEESWDLSIKSSSFSFRIANCNSVDVMLRIDGSPP